MFKVACIQFCSGKNVNKNFKISKNLILKAIRQNSDLIITPETSSLFGLNKKELLKYCNKIVEVKNNTFRFIFNDQFATISINYT